MYGMVNKAIEEMVCAGYGEPVWESIKTKADIDVDVFITNESYDDDVTYRLVAAASEILQAPSEDILVRFGRYWVLETAQKGYGQLLQSAGKTLPEFLVNLDAMHTRVRMIFPKLIPPRIEVSDVTESTLKLHYHSHRPGLAPFVVGLVEGLGDMFSTPAQVKLITPRGDSCDHDLFRVTWVPVSS
jgi:hypothetical protein